jgi:REP element-mobilizing transposase RayT
MPIFESARDWRAYIGILGDVVGAHEWTCHGFCLMPNHTHLLVEVPEESLPLGMQQLSWRYAIRFNLRYGHTGHLFERRYWSAPVEREAHLLYLHRYLARNPVRAGLCSSPSAWPWSSYAAALEPSDRTSFVAVHRALELFGSVALFRAFVEAEADAA